MTQGVAWGNGVFRQLWGIPGFLRGQSRARSHSVLPGSPKMCQPSVLQGEPLGSGRLPECLPLLLGLHTKQLQVTAAGEPQQS